MKKGKMKKIILSVMFLGMMVIVAQTANAQAPKGYVYCANEGQRCNTGDRNLTSIAYGANGKYKYRSVRNGVACTNRIFGDPTPGTRKKCYKFRKGARGKTRPDSTSRNNRSNCRPNANQIAVFTEPNYRGRCVIRNAGNYSNASRMGVPNDSISSIKVGRNVSAMLCMHNDFREPCYSFRGNQANLNDRQIRQNQVSSFKVIKRRTTPATRPRHSPPNSNFKPCAVEGGRCNLRGRNTVAYGANGRFRYKRNVSSVACNSATFGDPVPGIQKRCYYRSNSPSTNARNISVVDYRGGRFAKTAPGKWIEYKTGKRGTHGRFTETKKDANAIYLRKSDGATIKIDLSTKKIFVNGRHLFNITRAN